RVALGHSHAADRTPGPCDLQRGDDRLFKPDALQHRVRSKAARQLLDALDGLVTAFADNIGSAELLTERDPLEVTAEQDDPLRTKALRRDHATEADRTVADDRDRSPRP